jgi:2-keto-4-pentenoate hydratase/2-oxohepta-3-ene-1,7-dioic acid hydratase in catechol pathway
VRLGRLAVDGRAHIFVLDDARSDGSALLLDMPHASMRQYIEERSDGSADALTPSGRRGISLDGASILAPIHDPHKIVAIGLNYRAHASESGMTPPTTPLSFAKYPSSITGPGEAIRWSRAVTDSVDFEAELAAIIGRDARCVAPEDALDYVFGYTCLNDVTARDLQIADGQWTRAKSLDTFTPIGPWIVTADELPDPQDLAITCRVNGDVFQAATTADMIFSLAEIIASLSESFTLHAGDVIATGTPPGVGWSREPRRLLRDGDTVSVAIAGIGEMSNPVQTRE